MQDYLSFSCFVCIFLFHFFFHWMKGVEGHNEPICNVKEIDLQLLQLKQCNIKVTICFLPSVTSFLLMASPLLDLNWSKKIELRKVNLFKVFLLDYYQPITYSVGPPNCTPVPFYWPSPSRNALPSAEQSAHTLLLGFPITWSRICKT